MEHTDTPHRDVPRVRGQMDAWAPYYDFLMIFMCLGRERAIREMTVRAAGVKPGDRVLEVGCGTGSLILRAGQVAGADGEAVGLDAAQAMLDRARRKARRAGRELTLVHGLMEDIPFPDDHFDVVLSSFMIHHLPGEEVILRGLSEVHRVLKPGGTLLVLDMKSLNQKLPPWFEQAGFVDIDQEIRYRVLTYVRGRA